VRDYIDDMSGLLVEQHNQDWKCDAPGFYLASLMLMTGSAESNPLTLVKTWST
jgi:hypothetical protein